MEQPRINVSRASGVAVVALAGEHDLSTLPSVEDELGRIGPARPCIVDLSAAAFIDSSILGVLIRLASSPEPPRCAGVVAPPGSAAGRLFALTAADRLLPVFESTDEAIRALRRAGDALVD